MTLVSFLVLLSLMSPLGGNVLVVKKSLSFSSGEPAGLHRCCGLCPLFWCSLLCGLWKGGHGVGFLDT